jgi:hypothetical protein
MTDDEKIDETLVELSPSRREVQSYTELAGHHRGQLVLISCTFEGKDRFAIARLEKRSEGLKAEPLALVLNEKDIIHLRGQDGSLLPTEESELLIN